ncbi:MAG TPA: TetR/AcrR family transcriptional regulator [Acidimicrobiales bacterium]
MELAAEGDDSTAARLLDAAERIFATKGIEAASVRAITQAAGANIAAVHYHFGSKLDLVRALVERRVSDMTAARRPLLDAALAQDEVTPRDVAEAWVRPLAALAFGDGGARRTYLSFLVVLQAASPELRSLANDVFHPQYERFAALLERALPDVAEPVRWFRFIAAVDVTIRALANPERSTEPWASRGGITDDELVEHVIDLATAILAGPTDHSSSNEPRRHAR